MIESDLRRYANKLKICLINVNSFKDCAEDRTSELNNLFINTKAQLYILTETKLTLETSLKFDQNYLGKLWKHSTTDEEDAGAGISIAYDPLMGKCDVVNLPPRIQNRAIAVRFKPPDYENFIILGVYAPASGNMAIKRNFIDQIFATRAILQGEYNCNVIIGGDFNSTVAHLENNMRDYKNTNFRSNSIAKTISVRMTECGYIHPFEKVVQEFPGREYLTFKCTTDTITATVSAKGIDHFLFPSNMSNQLENLCISDNFFAGSKHKAVSIVIKNLLNLPICSNQQHNLKQFIPSIVWNDPYFTNSSKKIYSKFLLEGKEKDNRNWDILMFDIKNLAMRSKKKLLRALLLENESNPNIQTKAKIMSFLPSLKNSQSQWSRSVSNVIPYLKDTDGNLTSSHAELCSIAKNHLKNLFQNKDKCSEQEIESFISKLKLPKFTVEEKEIMIKPFSYEELENVITHMPAEKSNGKDNIPIDIFKKSKELISILLEATNNTFLKNQPLPESLRVVLFRLIPKEKDSTDLDNYRPIGLLPMAYRIISKAITTRLQPMLSRIIGPHQYAYINGRRSENIGRIISEMMFQTTIDPNLNILTLKLDFRKAFDSMSYQYVKCFLRNIDTPDILTNFIMHLITNLKGSVIINNGLSDTFTIERGTTQGSALSAILFVLCLEGLCCTAVSNPTLYGAAQLIQLNLSLVLLAFADDICIFTTLQSISPWLSLLSLWGSLSGVTLNIPKCLLNFWSHKKKKDNVPNLENLLLNNPCPVFQVGIFNEDNNTSGWRISENGDFKLLGLNYSFNHHEFDSYNSNINTNKLISFTNNTWNVKNILLPDPRIKLACALYAASDNIFDRLIDLKTLFVSGLIFKFYNCPCTFKTMYNIQNQANVVLLSPSAIKTPYIKLTTLFQSYKDGGCHHVSIQSISKAISTHTIILLLSGSCDKWTHYTYRRDLLRIVYANYFYLMNKSMRFLPFETIYNAGLHYLFGLPLTACLMPDEAMLWINYASISNFISIPKNTTTKLKRKSDNPTSQDLDFFQRLLLEPLWLNKLFLNPAPTNQITDLLLFKEIWNLQSGSIIIPTHETTCSDNCMHDDKCYPFWASCIPSHIIDFASWCSPHYIPTTNQNHDTPIESTIFTLELHPHLIDATPLPECSVKSLTAYYTSIRVGLPNLNLITGVCSWKKHWPQHTMLFTWEKYFELVDRHYIDKSVRSAYWKLLHRCHIPMAKNSLTNTPYVHCKFCTSLNRQELFNPEHAIFGCPKVLQFWHCIITYVMRINHYFDNNLSFLTIISLGLHNMDSHECPSDILIATHNIIGFGIKTLTLFPIDSSDSLEISLISFRHQFRYFIKNVVESKINTHLTNHDPNSSLSPALRSAVTSELSMWNILRDNNPGSHHTPTWSDYTYFDPV